MNELANLKFSVDFKPSQITIQNEEQLEKLVNQTTEAYSSLVFTDDNIPEAKTARADLNKISKALDEQRKDVKNKYSEPLKAFEQKINGYKNQIKEVSEKIGTGISEYEEKQKEIRSEKLLETLSEMAPNYKIEAAAIEVKASWLNQSSFTKKGELTKKVLEEIAGQMTLIAKEQQRIADDKKIIFNYAKAVNLDADGWANWIDQGHTAAEVMKQIDQAVADKKAREEKEAADLKAHQEYEQAMKELRQRQVNENTVDTQTGEIINEDPELDRQEIEEYQTVTLQLTGTHEQLNALNNFIVNEGIKVEVV